MERYGLMLVDDEPWALIGMEEIIDWEAAGFEIVARCSCGTEALNEIQKKKIDAVITDIRMPDMDGLQLIEKLREYQPELPCMVVSAYSDFSVAREALCLAAVYYIVKPLSVEEVERAGKLLREKLDRTQSMDRILQIDSEKPSFPKYVSADRKCRLLLSLRRDSLPERKSEASLWQEIRMGRYYGLLTDYIGGEKIDEVGISCAFENCNDADGMIRSAKASLKGKFIYADMEANGKAGQLMSDVQLYLFEHMSEELSLSQLAQHFYLTEAYLSDLFKKTTGRTITHFLRDLRLERSKQLLRDTDDTLAEIALRCGYRDYSYYGKQFKNSVGVSPEQYRRQLH